MTLASNPAVAWVNLFDRATITIPGVATDTPAARLQQADVATKCRIVGTTMVITATWASDQTADTFGMFGVGDKDVAAGAFLSTGTTRLQLTSSGGATGDVY